MRTFNLPQGYALTQEQFTQSAIETPLSVSQTLGSSIVSGFSQTIIGTAAREAYAPDTAFKPVAGGRGGMRALTPQEVAAKGDTLYETPDAYQGSDYYRESVPFEKGMTESRAKALSEMSDLQAIRDHFGAKRPVTNFLGQIAGAALAPENYVPVLGEWAGAATTVRMGKVAARIALASGDAALNTAAVQLLTRDQRAKFGDDVSWQAMGENIAAAALFGAALGGIIGGVGKFRERYSAPEVRTAPIVTPEAARASAIAERIAAREAIAPAIVPDTPLPDAPIRLDIGTTPEARFGSTWNHVNVIDRIETPEVRAKAAAVLNDAVTGLAIDGEIRLGEQARINIDDVQGKATKTEADTAREAAAAVPATLDAVKAKWDASGIQGAVSENKGLVTVSKIVVPETARQQGIGTAAMSDLTAYADATGKRVALSPSSDFGGSKPRLTAFYKRFGFKENKGKSRDLAVSETMIRDPLPQTEQTPAKPNSSSAKPNSVKDAASLRSSANFTVPTPAPALPSLGSSYRLVDALPKGAPEQARLADAAKLEGIDPETGGNDLETDIEILRETGRITAEEEAALKAADETFAGAKAWADVAAAVLTCRIAG